MNKRLIERIDQLAKSVELEVIECRRDFHRYAEAGWAEFRTASLVARRLTELGYQVHMGRDVIEDEARMGLPPVEELEHCWQRAWEQGGDKTFLPTLKGGFTGVVGVLKNSRGATVGLRFDMDALALQESQRQDHKPFREGFASVNAGVMHACGHDAHTAIGLGIAKALMALKDTFRGTVKLVFQPAEEGVRGAKSMVAAGVVDDVDYMLGQHLYSGQDTGQVTCGLGGYLATTKFDAFFHGEPAHAAANPHSGKNALLAAATAVLNLHAIPRHRQGPTRVNVGRLEAGLGRNVICADAHLVIETRGETSELNQYVYDHAVRILQAAAAMHNCKLDIKAMGGAQSASSDPELSACVKELALQLGFSVRQAEGSGGSEDYTYMMRRVQENGGQAINIGVGADLGGWGHHTAEFDVDEAAFRGVIRLLTAAVLDILNREHSEES